jgi:hypothetical protein
MSCGETFNQTEGEFSSPGYPLAYKSNLKCDYKIVMPASDYVVIEFLPPFEIEKCNCNFI